MFKRLLRKGIRFTIYSTGKIFNPADQERSDAYKDIDKGKTKRMLDKIFHGGRK